MPSLGQFAKDHEDVNQILRGPSGHSFTAASINELTGGDFNTSETAVRRWRRDNQWKPLPQTDDEQPVYTAEHVEPVSSEERNAELQAANTRLFKALSKEKEKSERFIQAIYDGARDAALSVGPGLASPTPTRDRRTAHEEVALWHSTDWQMAKVTSTYDSETTKVRLQKYVDKAREITEVMRADHPVKHGVVLFTGDMLEGCNIFPAQEYEIDAALYEQIFQTAEAEEKMIREALETYETVDVICEWGNHGRIGRKSDGFKPSDNVDRIIYGIVQQRFANEDRIKKFQVSDAWYQHFTVGNYSAIAIHGDEIKSFGGNTPSYGILRKANAWASGVVEPFIDMYLGHYHSWMDLPMANGGTVFMTGSVESDNEYAREFVAATNKPSQRVNFINPRKGFVTYESKVWL